MNHFYNDNHHHDDFSYKSIIKNKNAGQTMTQFIDSIKQDFEEKFKSLEFKMCYSGRLDPMARGKVIILLNGECKKVESYNKKSKTYQFEIIVGLQTKSDDPLGEFEKINLEEVSIDKVNSIKQFTETYLQSLFNQNSFYQKFHNYSSKKVNGEPLWLHSQNQNQNLVLEKDFPKHLVSIYDYELKDIKSYDYQNWKDEIVKLIDTIDKNCNFNQENIIKQWNKLYIEEEQNKKIYSIPINLTVSSGFYVRQFVRDLSNIINFPLMVYDINRTEIYL